MSKGLELSLQTISDESSRFNWRISYALGKAEYEYSDDHYSPSIPFLYDRRHSVFAWAQFRTTPKLNVALTWRYGSGLPYYKVVRFYQAYESDTRLFEREALPSKRLPDYHRLDIRLNYQVKPTLSCYLDLINVYNHDNIYDYLYYYSMPYDETTQQIVYEVTKMTVTMMPFLPSFGISWQF